MENKSAEARGYIYALEKAVERDSKGALLLVIDFFGSCDALGTYDEYPKIIVRLR